jgi:hypothetical protein
MPGRRGVRAARKDNGHYSSNAIRTVEDWKTRCAHGTAVLVF